jgi:hypothetical protein
MGVDPTILVEGFDIRRVLSASSEFAAVDATQSGGARRLLLVCRAPSPRTIAKLRHLIGVHRRVRASMLPKISDHDLNRPAPFVAFDCSVDCSAATFWHAVSQVETALVPYDAACATADIGLELLIAMHEEGLSCGVASRHNSFFDASGQPLYLGFGSDILLVDSPHLDPFTYTALEVRNGSAATPGSDMAAFADYSRELLKYVDVPPALYERRHRWIEASVRYVAQAIDGSPLLRRYVTAKRLRFVLRRRWRKLGADPSLESWQRAYHRLSDRVVRVSTPPHPEPHPTCGERTALCCHHSFAWFRVGDDAPVDVSRLTAPRLILRHLVGEHQRSPGKSVSSAALQELVWPGEVLLGQSGKARVQVAISTLRKKGLREYLVYANGGYLIDPAAVIRVET